MGLKKSIILIFIMLLSFSGMILTYFIENIFGYILSIIFMYVLLISVLVILLSLNKIWLKRILIMLVTLFFVVVGCFLITNLFTLVKYNNLSDEEYIVQLNNAIVNSDDNKVETLLKQDRDVSKCRADYYDGDVPCSWTLTPLQLASNIGNYDYVKLLIENGADVNGPNYTCYQSPLLYAIKSQNDENKYDIIKLLLEEGANTNAEDKYGKTALYYSEGQNDDNIIELLKKTN